MVTGDVKTLTDVNVTAAIVRVLVITAVTGICTWTVLVSVLVARTCVTVETLVMVIGTNLVEVNSVGTLTVVDIVTDTITGTRLVIVVGTRETKVVLMVVGTVLLIVVREIMVVGTRDMNVVVEYRVVVMV